MLISPTGLPEIRLSYTLADDDGNIIENSVVDVETFAYTKYPHSLIFNINDMGCTKQINYDILNGAILQEASYVMASFELLKLEESKFIYVGTLFKTDLEEGSYNIKIAGRLVKSSIESLPYLTLPSM